MKQVERFNISPVEQELSFADWCRGKKIKKLLFDGDDTLWEIKPLVTAQENKCYDYLASTKILSRDEWKSEMIKINDFLFEKYCVNPNRWNLIIDELTYRYSLKLEDANTSKEILSKIYQIPPHFIKDTQEALKFFRKIGNPDIGIVTHASREWTLKKFQWLNLQRFLSFDDIYVVDQDHHKTKESWQNAMDYFRVEPRNCLVAGDSPRADINPAISLGVEHCFLVRNSFELWSLHQQDVDETKVRSITSVNDLRFLGAEMIFRNPIFSQN